AGPDDETLILDIRGAGGTEMDHDAGQDVTPEVWKNTLEALDESLGVLTDQDTLIVAGNQGAEGFGQDELKHFYEVKYSSFLPPPTPEAIQGMIRTHASVQPDPFTQEELASAIGRCKSNTSAGMDGVGYEAIKAYFRQDAQGKLLSYFNQLLFRTLDYHLRGLQDKWTQDYPAWGDNLKLHELADTLATIGACRPLEGKDRLMFLGVPLAHTNSPDLVLAHPLRTKAVLFESYISSKWLWCGMCYEEDLLGKVMLSPKKLPERRGGGGQGGTEMPAKRPRLDAEVLALAKLQQDDFVTKEDALAVLRLIPNGEWSPHHGGRSISFGAFQRATSALRATTRRYHIATRLLTKLVRQWSPDTSFTSMTILDNAKCPPHMDCRNSEVPGMLMTLTQGYTGGELWLAHERGGERMLHAGIWRQGIKIDVTTPFCFSARSILHATCAWSGDRIALAAYSTPRSTVNLDETKTFRLVSLGFRPPTPELEDRFRYEQWGATVTKQLRMQPRLVWPAGVLLQTGPIRLDLEDDSLPPTVAVDSESESDVVFKVVGNLRLAPPIQKLYIFTLSHGQLGVLGLCNRALSWLRCRPHATVIAKGDECDATAR
ncbi:unnamed protein product, partial [Symbiodinium sp. KB8]